MHCSINGVLFLFTKFFNFILRKQSLFIYLKSIWFGNFKTGNLFASSDIVDKRLHLFWIL